MNWLHWLGIELACAWMWVETLGDPKETSFFCHFWSSFEVERLRKSLAEVSVRGSWKASQLVSLNGHFSPGKLESKPISELEWSFFPS